MPEDLRLAVLYFWQTDQFALELQQWTQLLEVILEMLLDKERFKSNIEKLSDFDIFRQKYNALFHEVETIP